MRPADKMSIMREGGQKLGVILQELLAVAKPGVTLLNIEELAQKRIKKAGGTPSFQTVPGYKWATCLCINEVVVHGVPTPYALREGDVLTIDIGMVYQGLHTDTAWTKIIGEQKTKKREQNEKFLAVGEQALWHAIEKARVGKKIGDISLAIQEVVEGAGYGVVKSLVGHGVGKELHEPPQIPGYLRGKIEHTLPLAEGMTIAIEVIYTMGKPTVAYANDDGWSIATQDKSVSACFEHTVGITSGAPLVITTA